MIIVGFLRPEENYDSLEKLIDAINNDIKNGQTNNKEEECAKHKTDSFFNS